MSTPICGHMNEIVVHFSENDILPNHLPSGTTEELIGWECEAYEDGICRCHLNIRDKRFVEHYDCPKWICAKKVSGL